MGKTQGMDTQSSTMYIQKGDLVHCDMCGIGEHYAIWDKSRLEK